MSNLFLENIEQTFDIPEYFETLCCNKNVRIEKITSNPFYNPNAQWYNQEQDEWVVLIDGSATLELEDNQIINLSKGDYLFIPAKQLHRVIQTHTHCLWLAIHIY